jgi:hypothetical protein
MKTLLAALITLTVVRTASAQTAEPAPQPTTCCIPVPVAQPQPAQPQPVPAALPPQAQPQQVAALAPESQPAVTESDQADDGWHRPVGRRFLHGFRLGWTYLYNMDKPTRMDENGRPVSLGYKYGLKSPNMMLLGYEGFYRIVGHSWLNVLMVGNVTVAGLEQSKFIPAASGLIGFEFDQSFQLGVGVNLTPDPDAPSHMIAAAGWTPSVGSIQTPVHFFFVPDTEGNHRMGATVGMTW